MLRDRLLREEDIRCGGGDCGKPFLNTLAGCCSGLLIGGGVIEMQLKSPCQRVRRKFTLGHQMPRTSLSIGSGNEGSRKYITIEQRGQPV